MSPSRFRCRIRALSHRSLYLPEGMRHDPKFRRILAGASPLEVFSCATIKEARLAFYELRKKYDFPYWVALHYRINDISNPYEVVPLRLNSHQRWLANLFISRLNDGLRGKYIIANHVPKCGVTTCIRAYFSWMQSCRYYQNSISITCSGNSHSVPVNESFHMDIPFYEAAACPETFKDFPAAFIHLADMDRWCDRDARKSSSILSSCLTSWIRSPSSLFILEGDAPDNSNFRLADYQDYLIPLPNRLLRLGGFSPNPFFLNFMAMAADPRVKSDYCFVSIPQSPNT